MRFLTITAGLSLSCLAFAASAGPAGKTLSGAEAAASPYAAMTLGCFKAIGYGDTAGIAASFTPEGVEKIRQLRETPFYFELKKLARAAAKGSAREVVVNDEAVQVALDQDMGKMVLQRIGADWKCGV
ncbi:MAG: hypothetical protein ACREH4_11285 [Vitreimonas sp.]